MGAKKKPPLPDNYLNLQQCAAERSQEISSASSTVRLVLIVQPLWQQQNHWIAARLCY